MRIPSEQTFSVVVRSVAAGSKTLEICTGTASRIRFSSRPDRTGICELTFQVGFRYLAPGWAVPKVAEANKNYSNDDSLKSIVPNEIEYWAPPREPPSIVGVSARTWPGRPPPSVLQSKSSCADRIVQRLN